MEETIRLLLLAPHPNEGTDRGIFIEDLDLLQKAIAQAHAQKPTQLLTVTLQSALTPTDEEQMKQLFPQEPPKSPPPAPLPIRSKNVDVAKEAEAKPVGV